MKKITLQHKNVIIGKGINGEFAHVLITAVDYDAFVEMVGPNKRHYYKSLIDTDEQVKIKVDDVYASHVDMEDKLNDMDEGLSIEEMLEKQHGKINKMLGFQLRYREKTIFVPFQKDRVLSIVK
jgi:hypothetical protein